MEWIIITAKTLEEAKDRALDQLGVDEQDAEFEVVEEPKPGLFGRLRGNFELRARVAPTAPRAKDGRRQPRKRKGKESGSNQRSTNGSNGGQRSNDDAKTPKGDTKPAAEAAAAPTKKESRPPRAPRNDRSGDDREQLAIPVAIESTTEFLQELVDKFGVTATVSVVEEPEGEVMARVEGEQLGRLIGPAGGMVAALEELCRTRLQHVAEGAPTPRLRVDVGGYLDLRRSNLESLVDDTVAKVRETGTVHVMDVVRAADRKLVHDRVGEAADDVTTKSEGEDPHRRVAIVPVHAG